MFFNDLFCSPAQTRVCSTPRLALLLLGADVLASLGGTALWGLITHTAAAAPSTKCAKLVMERLSQVPHLLCFNR